ncbi:unnamed protein product [Closterium sp. NIES-54]
MVHQVLQRFRFQFSLPQHTPLSTSHSLSAPHSDESVEPSGPYPELVGCLITSGMGLVLGGRGPVVLIGHEDASWPQLLPGSLVPAHAPHPEVNESLTERPCVALPSPPAYSLLDVLDPASDLACAAGPNVACLLATVVINSSFESTATFSLVTELVDFAASRRLDYVASLVTESERVCPQSVRVSLPLAVTSLRTGNPDALDISTPRSYAEAIAGEYSSQLQTAMDAEMASWKSTGTYVNEVRPRGANIVDGMWIFRVKRPSGSPPAFKARYVAHGFSQRQGVDYFQTFSPTPKMTTLWVLLHVAPQRDYELHCLNFSTAFLQGSLHEWHDTLRTTLAALGFAPSSADPSLFLRIETALPPFYVLVYVDDLVFAIADTKALALALQLFGFQYSSPQPTPLPTGHLLLAPPWDESVELSCPYLELVGCLMYLMTCTRPDLT